MAAAQATRPTLPRARPLRPAPHIGSWEVSGGGVWQGGIDLGEAEAEITRNPTTGTGPFTLFSAGSKLGSGFGAQGRIAFYLSKSLAVEGGLRVTRPVLEIDLSDDVEAAAGLRAAETLTQYVVEGSAVWHFGAFGGVRSVPFVAAGAGYIRDLHEGNELMETGTEYHAVAGLKWWFSNRPRRFGLRGEAGVSVRDGGFDFKEGQRTVPVAALSVIYLF